VPRLTKAQRNRVFLVIRDAEMDPSGFEWHTSKNVLLHDASRSQFNFGPVGLTLLGRVVLQQAGRDVAYFVGGRRGGTVRATPTADALYQVVDEWLAEIRAESEPDLWKQQLGVDAGENTRFTREEVAEIRTRLDAVLDEVRAQGRLSADELAALDETLSYLKAAAERMGRIDWRNAVVGALLGAMGSAVLPPETVQDVLLAFTRGLAHLYIQRFLPGLPRGS
jgi:hypothetical protein